MTRPRDWGRIVFGRKHRKSVVFVFLCVALFGYFQFSPPPGDLLTFELRTSTLVNYTKRRLERKRALDETSVRRQLIVESASQPSLFPAKTDYVILLWTKIFNQQSFLCDLPPGGLIAPDCPTRNCKLTCDRGRVNGADAVLFHIFDLVTENVWPPVRLAHQRWTLWFDEAPPSLQHALESLPAAVRFNWTMSYRSDSEVAEAYGTFRLRFSRQAMPPHQMSVDVRSEFESRSRYALWFVSHCDTANQRLKFANDLAIYISIDIFGQCGQQLVCPRESLCEKQLYREYKFYLAFENSNCQDYITEKVWKNALDNHLIPVVMGATRRDYEAALPPNSFIHVQDFASTQALAAYLLKVATNLELYAQYFQWRAYHKALAGDQYANRFCALCHMLNGNDKVKYYTDLRKWVDVCYPLQWNNTIFQ